MSTRFLRPFIAKILEDAGCLRRPHEVDEQIDDILKRVPVESFLQHEVRPLSGGGQVVLLDTGAIINPEAVAMLQAMYSRDPNSVFEHLKKVAEKGADGFMKTYYVEYGHKSIADCATATFFIEGVSMLTCKAIQDTMLYAGQEASTRYLDFATAPFVDPMKHKIIGTELLARYRTFYLKALPALVEHFTKRFPIEEGWSEVHYKKAIKARAFDVARGFLPAGAQSSAAWHANLRLVADRIPMLRNHPLEEVREVARALGELCIERFPSSFGHKVYPAAEAYNALTMSSSYYYEPRNVKFVTDRVSLDSKIDKLELAQLIYVDGEDGESINLLAERPQYSEVPKWIGVTGTMRIGFPLDFGSFRDIQRHRALIQRMPLLTTKLGFEQWYVDELPSELVGEALVLIADAVQVVSSLQESKADRFAAQYYVPMGFRVMCDASGDLPAVTYLVERRARADVHPTLRTRMYELAHLLSSEFEDCGLRLYVDPNPDEFSLKRGQQDIVPLIPK
jgi:thymidylate synthase ThyX